MRYVALVFPVMRTSPNGSKPFIKCPSSGLAEITEYSDSQRTPGPAHSVDAHRTDRIVYVQDLVDELDRRDNDDAGDNANDH